MGHSPLLKCFYILKLLCDDDEDGNDDDSGTVV